MAASMAEGNNKSKTNVFNNDVIKSVVTSHVQAYNIPTIHIQRTK